MSYAQDAASPIQRVVTSIWKAVLMLEGRPAATPKMKLHGRRGYGDGDLPAPDITPETASHSVPCCVTDIGTGRMWWEWRQGYWVLAERLDPATVPKRHK